MDRWHVPKIWKSDAFILGGGPSLLDVDLWQLKGKNVIAVNNAYRVAPFAQFLYFMDGRWWDWHEEALQHWPNTMVTSCERAAETGRVKYLKRGRRNVFDPRPGYISKGSNSGHGAICLATALGATRTILLGFDMHAEKGHNFHQEHGRVVPETIYKSNYFISFEMLAPTLPEGVEVINATPDSALKVFPYRPLEAFI